MRLPARSPKVRFWLGIGIGSVWVFHGLYSKILLGIPRHQLIVARILGDEWARPATLAIGFGEILLGLWTFSGWRPRFCVLAQTLVLVAMNTLEILRAEDLLISAFGMVFLNFLFLSAGWIWASSAGKGGGQSQPA